MSVAQFHKWLAQRGFVRAEGVPVPEECAGQAVFKMPLVSETKATKAADGELRVHAIMTTPGVDRQGDIVEPKGVSLKWFKKNPVVMWAHQYDMPPIGHVDTKTIVVSDRGIEADVIFDKGSVAGQEVYGLYERKVMSGWSIGFIPVKWDVLTDPKSEKVTGYRIAKSELLELSSAPVPANPETLSRQIAQLDEYEANGYEAAAFCVVKSLREAVEPHRKAVKAWEEKRAKAAEAPPVEPEPAPEPEAVVEPETEPEPQPAPVMVKTVEPEQETPDVIPDAEAEPVPDKPRAIENPAEEPVDLKSLQESVATVQASIAALAADVKVQAETGIPAETLERMAQTLDATTKRIAAIEASEAERRTREVQLEADRKRKAGIEALADVITRRYAPPSPETLRGIAREELHRMRGGL
ncbi:MAG TPA: HK97 family phage prohead protease [Phycisphaerae bacterium]|nr:HK97 family phage prohead protease [Phycisphaerae bacterium]